MANFPIIKKGYEQQEVDEFISKLEQEITAFRLKEQFISQALVEAQVTAKKIMEEAELHAFQIEKNALLRLEHLKHEMDYTRQRLTTFQNDYNQFIDKFKLSFSNNELSKLFNTLDELASTLDKSIDKEKNHKEDDSVSDPLAIQELTSEGSDFEY